ncbi:MAG: 23S rRNA (adenine(2503)-C(2))-methyltransferase RlmN, partial [Myxococcales bacterium]|nr:23S rRNA (adenine(2503)-C(2))-methyltransferase RlmN [Myxococcales bacterium]
MASSALELEPPGDPLSRLPEEWAEHLRAKGHPRFRGLQVFQWIHGRGVLEPERMANLPRALRAELEEEGLGALISAQPIQHAEDGTLKFLMPTSRGGQVESVLIPQLPSGDPDDEDEPASDEEGAAQGEPQGPPRPPGAVTQCVSSQVGCAMGCVFCASGQAGLERNLSAGEIVGQALLGRALLGEG